MAPEVRAFRSKDGGTLHCTALWASRQILYLILALIGKTCKSMITGVILSLENLGKPVTILAAQLINIWRPLRMIFGRPLYKLLQNSIIENTSPCTSLNVESLLINMAMRE